MHIYLSLILLTFHCPLFCISKVLKFLFLNLLKKFIKKPKNAENYRFKSIMNLKTSIQTDKEN